MIFFYDIIDKENIDIHVRMESDSGDIVGETIEELHPSEKYMGVHFEKFIEDGTGEMEI